MNILMVTPDCGMIDRRILLEAKSLIGEGHTVTLLAGFECGEEESYTEDNIPIYRYKFQWVDEREQPLLAKAARYKWVGKIAAKLYNFYYGTVTLSMSAFEYFIYKKIMLFEADVIQAIDLPVLKSCVFAAKERNLPLFYDAHELYYAQDVFTEDQRKRWFRTEKRYIRDVDEVFTVNQFIAEIMAKRYRMAVPHVLFNATDVEAPPEKDRLRGETGLGETDRIVLYQGWISPERNIDKLVESAAFYDEGIYLVLIGYGDFADRLKEICRERQIGDRVFFLGKKESGELPEYTATADLGVIPYQPIDENHLYCSPNKLFEFVASGLPFICNELPFFQYIREEHGVLEFCDMGNPEGIAAEVNRLAGNKDRLAELKRNCEKARLVLNWSVEVKKMVKVYARYAEKTKVNKGNAR